MCDFLVFLALVFSVIFTVSYLSISFLVKFLCNK